MPLSIVLILVALVAVIGPAILMLGMTLAFRVLVTLGVQLDVQPGDAAISAVLVAVGLPLYMGILYHKRVAWRWGRGIALMGTVFFAVSGIIKLVQSLGQGAPPPLFPFFAAVLLFATFFLLSRPSAREYFKLRCPHCQSFETEAADFRFRKAKCRKCLNVW